MKTFLPARTTVLLFVLLLIHCKILPGQIIGAGAGYHNLVLKSDGTVYSWGYNQYGQLGNGTNTNSNVPVAVSRIGVLGGKTIIQVAGGYQHSIALTSEGTVYTWGLNDQGQFGNEIIY